MTKRNTKASSSLVHESVLVGAGTMVKRGAEIQAHGVIGQCTTIERGVHIGQYCAIGNDVFIGRGVRIGPRALIMSRAVVCRNNVVRTSSDARILQSDVTIGAGVLLHDQVELGTGAIVPSQRTIASLGNFGTKNRVVTIYGSDAGPRYSIGCQIGVSLETIEQRVAINRNTTPESADTYMPFLDVFQAIGGVVQAAYDAEAGHIEELRDMRRSLSIGS